MSSNVLKNKSNKTPFNEVQPAPMPLTVRDVHVAFGHLNLPTDLLDVQVTVDVT